MKQPLFFDWGVSMLFGWGVYGVNLLRHWPRVAAAPALAIGGIQLESLSGTDPLTLRALAPALVDSDALRTSLEGQPEPKPVLDGIVLHSLGNRMTGSIPPRDGGYRGTLSTSAAIFFEDTLLPNAAEISRGYDMIVTGSTWCEEILRAKDVKNVATVIQGIDPSIFHPAPRADTLGGRFAIFSGGKLEIRKGQDLVLLAFRAFAQRHPEAILVTAWRSPWPIAALTLNSNDALEPIALREDGDCDIEGWVTQNGLRPDQFIDLGSIPNHQMARVLREMDVALFPNRCEGGTNLVAMECMACAVPVILAANTGHKDIMTAQNSFPLLRQGPVIDETRGTQGWGESDIEEIVESLEFVWRDRGEARRRGLLAAQAMAQLSWHNQIGQLHQALTGFGRT